MHITPPMQTTLNMTPTNPAMITTAPSPGGSTVRRSAADIQQTGGEWRSAAQLPIYARFVTLTAARNSISGGSRLDVRPAGGRDLSAAARWPVLRGGRSARSFYRLSACFAVGFHKEPTTHDTVLLTVADERLNNVASELSRRWSRLTTVVCRFRWPYFRCPP